MIISVEGNIGSGKSTLVELLSETFSDVGGIQVVTLQEPVSVWESIQDAEGESMLTKFYRDQKKYSFAFQMMAYISRLAALRQTIRENPKAIILTERCVETDRNVFAKMLHDDGKIEEVEYQIYLKWFDEFIQDIPVTAYLYVKADATTCAERIVKRNREGETVPLEYLERCGQYHERWLEEIITGGLDNSTQCLVLDANQEMTDSLAFSWLTQIRQFIQTHSIQAKETDMYSQV